MTAPVTRYFWITADLTGSASGGRTGEVITLLTESPGPFNVYPNPVISVVYVEQEKAGADYNIFTSEGKQVKTGVLGKGQNAIDVSSLEKGIYFLVLTHQQHRLLVAD